MNFSINQQERPWMSLIAMLSLPDIEASLSTVDFTVSTGKNDSLCKKSYNGRLDSDIIKS